MPDGIRLAFAGDRQIAVRVLQFLGEQGVEPLALLVPDGDRASHAQALRDLCPSLPEAHVLYGTNFRSAEGVALLSSLRLDFIVGVHFPYVVPAPVLRVCRRGFLNLHPAYLPYNRGWHTPSWSILDGGPAGATVHLMDTGIDTGDVIHQKQLTVSPADTAHALYQRLMDLEFSVFVEAWPDIAADRIVRRPQNPQSGSQHQKADLLTDAVRKINLKEQTTAEALLRRLRALTTNKPEEAAWFESGGQRYRVRVEIEEEP